MPHNRHQIIVGQLLRIQRIKGLRVAEWINLLVAVASVIGQLLDGGHRLGIRHRAPILLQNLQCFLVRDVEVRRARLHHGIRVLQRVQEEIVGVRVLRYHLLGSFDIGSGYREALGFFQIDRRARGVVPTLRYRVEQPARVIAVVAA